MEQTSAFKFVTIAIVAVALAACGGGGGGGSLNSTPRPPTPPPPPPPPPSAPSAIEIFEAPATQEFAALGSDGPGDELRIRYDAVSNQYQVMLPGQDWAVLVENPSYEPPAGQPDSYFAFGAVGTNSGQFFTTSASYRAADPAVQYHYSNLAAWGTGVGAYWDNLEVTAFGMATQAGGVPVSGTASYEGLLWGSSTVEEFDGLIGASVEATVHGAVNLHFDFGLGTLSGAMHPTLNTYGGLIDLGTLTFTNTVYSVGSQNFSGQFATGVNGANNFSGLFTGPNAQELIARWTFPFIYPADGSTHSATGAWIAKK